MSVRPWIGCAVGVLLLTLVAPNPLAVAEPEEAEWKALTRGLRRLMRSPGQRAEKVARLARIAADDSQRAMAAVVDWALAANTLRTQTLPRATRKANQKLEQYQHKLKRRHGDDGGARSEPERKKLRALESSLAAPRMHGETEAHIDRALGEAALAMQAPAAWTWLFETGLVALRRGKYAGALQTAVFEGLSAHPGPAATAAAIGLVQGPTPAEVRVRALDWVGAAKQAEAYGAVLVALQAKVVSVRRAAVRALYVLDDPRCVPPLIQALGDADGLLATEIDQVLFAFTGLTLEGDALAWARWWKDVGPTWKAGARHAEQRRRNQSADAEFYGIRSPSKRIIFVVDQSGSMQKPINGRDAQTAEPRPGGSRLQAARLELKRAIQALAQDVRFNVIFYADGVTPWRAPRGLHLATAGNKQTVLRWLDDVEPEGTTALFRALHRTLAYADSFSGEEQYANPGVDTVYLLTDGSPTDLDGNPLSARAIETELLAFSVANEVHRVVVHTVGIGRGHNRRLMERIAKGTGGTYVRVIPK